MELDSVMFDEAFEFQDNQRDGPKYYHSNPPQDERWPPLGAASTEDSFTSFRENEQRYVRLKSALLLYGYSLCFRGLCSE